MAKYIVQKAVGPDKVKKKLQRSLEDYATTFAAQPKLDGCCAVMFLPLCDVPYVQSRTGETYVSLNGVARRLSLKFARDIVRERGLVLIGEAWNPNLPFNEISGLFRRGEETDELLFMVFDVLTMDEFNAGHSPVGWQERINRLVSDGAEDDLIVAHEPGTYGDVLDFLKSELALGGRDGIILRDPNGTWTAGSGTTGEIVKIKQSLSFDLMVTGTLPGTGKHEGRMGALTVSYGGKTLKVGTGFSDDERDNWWTFPTLIVGKIVEVEAMDYSADGLLREPRFKGIRHDKLAPDTIAA
jgi:ATP-dependent DNA ligase